MLTEGIKNRQVFRVTDQNTAEHLLSGMLPVYATPMMIAHMEYTCFTSVHPLLEEGLGTVGSRLEISHLSPTPVGGTVTVESELVTVDGRRLVFRVSAYDDQGLIGEGTHERFIIDNARFMAKVEKKRASLKAEAPENEARINPW
ncbi:MAG: thioesterase family protein [Clostridia bacterium]|nr:thioesterase family protein [Clostridia bacterium]